MARRKSLCMEKKRNREGGGGGVYYSQTMGIIVSQAIIGDIVIVIIDSRHLAFSWWIFRLEAKVFYDIIYCACR